MRWLIDGHNLIGHMPNLRLDDPDDEEKLLAYLYRYRARTGQRLTVIFDSGPGYQLAQTIKRGGLTVQFAAHGKTADQLIRQRLRRVKNPQEIIVVSSDREVQQAAHQVQVRVIEAWEFGQQLLQLSGGVVSPPDVANQADIHLSAAEVDEWLAIFRQRKT